jgi:hypothetical protein
MGREMPEVGLQRGKAIPKDRSKFHHCSICGAVLPNEPKPMLRHQMSHVRRRPVATSAPSADQPGRDDETASQ